MTFDVESNVIEPPLDAASDGERALALLHQQGADQCSPVDFHYMETLARRMRDQTADVRRILESKLALALAAYQANFEKLRGDEVANKHQADSAHPKTQTPLGQLVRSMTQPTTELETSNWAAAVGSRIELKSVSNFRNTWSKLSAQKHVAQAMGQAPKNAGPINSHMLVLRSLKLMRDISPDYLNRFMSYADTLLCLEQTDLSAKVPQTKPFASATPPAKPTPTATAKSKRKTKPKPELKAGLPADS